MMREGIHPAWIRDIDNKLTFCGALEEYYEDCAKYWKKEATRKQYDRDYNDKILPNLLEHDAKPIEAYTKEDYESAIFSIAEQGQNKKGEGFVPYADSTLQHFRHLIDVVVCVASDHGLCDNVLWGSHFSIAEEYTVDDAIKERVKLKKSLSVAHELAIAKMLLTNVTQRGQEMGLLLMYALGLRNGEACGANYGDIRPMIHHPECKVLWVYKSTVAGTNILQSSGKTRNADRILPVPDVLEQFLEERRRYLQETVVFSPDSEIQSVDDLPIACVGDNYVLRCSASQLTSAGRELFRRSKLEEDQLAYIDATLSQTLESGEMTEKDPTAYLFRRNFGTHLHILGLSEAEIEYVIGHDIDDDYETRNEFVNEEKLYEIKLKLDQRPILNTAFTLKKPQEIPLVAGQYTPIRGDSAQTVSLKLVSGHIKMNISAREPLDRLKIRFVMPSQTDGIRKTSYSSSTPVKYERTIDILNKYHSLYRESKKE